MKVVSNEALTKLIQLIKSTFIKIDDTETTDEIELSTVATSGDYDDLSNKPTVDQTYNGTSTNAQSGVAVAQVLVGKPTFTPLINYDSLPTGQYGGTAIGTYTLLDNVSNYDYLMVLYSCFNAATSKQTMIDKVSAFSLPALAAISLSRGEGASEYYIHEAKFTISGNQIIITSNSRTPVAGAVDTNIGQVRFLDIQGIKF